MALPVDFLLALEYVGRAGARYFQASGRHIVIVGGAAVSFYTQGEILSGDIDIVADIAFTDAMRAEGFLPDDTPERLRTATTFLHPQIARIGFQLVSSALFDGRTDSTHLKPIALTEKVEIVLPPIEDMIADRLGQFAASDGRDQDMRRQAYLLFELAADVDNSYLLQRISEEGGDPAVLGLS